MLKQAKNNQKLEQTKSAKIVKIPPEIQNFVQPSGQKLNRTTQELLAQILYYTKKHGYCFASNEHLAEKFSKCEKTIKRGVKFLEGLGLIIRVRVKGIKRALQVMEELLFGEPEPVLEVDQNATSGEGNVPQIVSKCPFAYYKENNIKNPAEFLLQEVLKNSEVLDMLMKKLWQRHWINKKQKVINQTPCTNTYQEPPKQLKNPTKAHIDTMFDTISKLNPAMAMRLAKKCKI
jgi:Helix-turn-helix domain